MVELYMVLYKLPTIEAMRPGFCSSRILIRRFLLLWDETDDIMARSLLQFVNLIYRGTGALAEFDSKMR